MVACKHYLAGQAGLLSANTALERFVSLKLADTCTGRRETVLNGLVAVFNFGLQGVCKRVCHLRHQLEDVIKRDYGVCAF